MATLSASSARSSCSSAGTISVIACAPMRRCSAANARAAASRTTSSASHRPERTHGMISGRNCVHLLAPGRRHHLRDAEADAAPPRHVAVGEAALQDRQQLGEHALAELADDLAERLRGRGLRVLVVLAQARRGSSR